MEVRRDAGLRTSHTVIDQPWNMDWKLWGLSQPKHSLHGDKHHRDRSTHLVLDPTSCTVADQVVESREVLRPMDFGGT